MRKISSSVFGILANSGMFKSDTQAIFLILAYSFRVEKVFN